MEHNSTSAEGKPAQPPRLPDETAITLGAQAASDGRSDVGRVRRPLGSSGLATAQETTNTNSGRATLTRNRMVTMTLASLNIRGLRGGRGMPRDKLRAVSGRMKTSKWSIAALQETHESALAAAELERANPRIWAYPNPGTNLAKGTMFLVHKDLLPEGITCKEDLQSENLVPGRAQTLKFKWRNGEIMTLVNIYAPNAEGEAVTFFQTLKRNLRGTAPIVMGDFNHVENEIDRQPMREPNHRVRAALTDLKMSLGLMDGWRYDNPGSHAYTWTSLVQTEDVTPRSRLDRILVPHEIRKRSLSWSILTPLGLSDHSPVTVELIDDHQPEMGPVRWRMATEEISDPKTIAATRECLLACERRIAKGEDAMTSWLNTKDKIKNIFENVKREKAKERTATLKNLEADLKKTRASAGYHQRKGVRDNPEAVEARIDEIKRRISEKAAETTAARYQALGETVSKYWFSTGKALQSRTMVRSMKDKHGVRQTDSLEMLETMRDYHEQLVDTPPMTRARQDEIDRITDHIKGTKLSERSGELLADKYSLTETSTAIKVSTTGKAPGPDGIPYEFYKKWNDMYDSDETSPKKEPSIAEIIRRAWNSPSKEATAPARYTEGLMALAYKKGDKELPQNYRPLTLLNTDLKLETKCLATRMGLTLPEIIHKDQAGFVPARDILDHVKMAQMVAQHCEVTETDGCLVAMDQEKAYDRIDHDYMWQILTAYGIPDAFLQRVKSLYANAHTWITLNRWRSEPFRIRRGVRQGDPMSCLLFDVAIEPLAEMLRQSGLRGLDVPHSTTRLICKLFADDTQIYLNKADDWAQAEHITDRWCLASTAKFNQEKTEVLPIGSERYRKRVYRTRTVAGTITGTRLPDGAKVFQTGESIRILGGRIGYDVDPDELWEPTLQKMEAQAEKWSKRHLTMKGRALVASFMVLSKGQYLMMTNPPSRATVKRVEKLTRKLMWAGKKSGTQIDVLYKPIEDGGLGLPDFGARVEASRLTWLKKWRQPPVLRPDWTAFLDETLKKAAKGSEKPWMTDVLEQTWRVRMGYNSPLSKDTREMLSLAKKYNVKADALKYTRQAKGQISIWCTENFEATATEENSAEARLLWKRHGVQTQAQLYGITPIPVHGCHTTTHAKCVAAAEKWKAKAKALINASTMTPSARWTGVKDNLDLTRRRIEKNAREAPNQGELILDPSVTHGDHIASATRIFGESAQRTHATYRQTNMNVRRNRITVYTDGSADKNGKANSNCGAGLWSENPELRGSFRIGGVPPTNNRGELAAAVLALDRAPINQELLIKTDSMYVLNFLTGGYKTAEDNGWLNQPNEDLLRRALYLVRRRTAPTLVQKVKAHSGHMGNEFADEAAKAALLLHDEELINTEVPTQWNLTGARLSTLSFSQLYEWIRHGKETHGTTRAGENLNRIAAHIAESTGMEPEHAEIWKGLRTPPIRKVVADFLWRAIHDRTVCGPYFRHWGGEWTTRQYCECGQLETIEHILTACQTRQWRTAVWDEYEKIMTESPLTNTNQVTRPAFEDILGAGARTSTAKNLARLDKIAITETTYVVWKLRNEQRIREKAISPVHARNAVRKAILDRAREDFVMLKTLDLPAVTKSRLRRKVGATWRGLVSRNGRQTDWVSQDFG